MKANGEHDSSLTFVNNLDAAGSGSTTPFAGSFHPSRRVLFIDFTGCSRRDMDDLGRHYRGNDETWICRQYRNRCGLCPSTRAWIGTDHICRAEILGIAERGHITTAVFAEIEKRNLMSAGGA